MNAEQVVEKILSHARAEADRLLAEAQAKADAEERRLQQELAEYNARTKTLAERAAEDMISQMTAAERMAQAKEFLAAKNTLLDELFSRLHGRVESLGDSEYADLMAGLLKRAAGMGEQEIIVGKNEHRIGQDLINRVNAELGGRATLKLSDKRADITGGFILASGKTRVNASIDVLVEQLRQQTEIESAERLFGD